MNKLIYFFFIVTFIERQAIENKLIHKMLKMKGSKNYDMDYFLNTFHKEKINNNIMDLIKKGNFEIEKTNQGGLIQKEKVKCYYYIKIKLNVIRRRKENQSLEEKKKKNKSNKTKNKKKLKQKNFMKKII